MAKVDHLFNYVGYCIRCDNSRSDAYMLRCVKVGDETPYHQLVREGKLPTNDK